MENSLFHKLEIEAYRKGLQARSKEARSWFRGKTKELSGVNRQSLLKDGALQKVKSPEAGDMYMFFYDAKGRKTLPYWDAFPLTIMVEPTKDGFYGLNLHYLSPMLRAKFLDKLMETANNSRFDDGTKLRLNYSLLKSVAKYREFQPCFKRYLTANIQGSVARVEAPEWDIAIFLPTEQFQGKNKTHVWGASKRMI
tara:strand:+ start:609 stop:1196 length:588 start_codon:yes stop_codon:yes gene_type:complete